MPGVVGRKLTLGGPVHAAEKGWCLFTVPLSSSVGQSAVMPGHGKGCTGLPQPKALISPGCGMVRRRPTPEPPLESKRILSDVMGQSGQSGLFFSAKRRSKFLCQFRSAGKMLQHCLLPSVRGNVGEICFHAAASLFF